MLKKIIKYSLIIGFVILVYNMIGCDNYYNYGRDTIYTFGDRGRIQIDVLAKNKKYIVTDVSKKFIIDYITKYEGPFFYGNKLYLNGDEGFYIIQKEPFLIIFIDIKNNNNQSKRLKEKYSEQFLRIYNSINNLDEEDRKQLTELVK